MREMMNAHDGHERSLSARCQLKLDMRLARADVYLQAAVSPHVP